MYGGSAAVKGFVAVDYELFFESDEHVGGEDDPERLLLDYAVTECSLSWVSWVVVGGVCHDVDPAVFAAECAAAEAD